MTTIVDTASSKGAELDKQEGFLSYNNDVHLVECGLRSAKINMTLMPDFVQTP